MRLKKLIPLIFPLSAFILELLPFGVLLFFANPEGEPFRESYSHFDLTPFGYGNVGPLITGILTLVILILNPLSLISRKRNFAPVIMAVSVAATLTSIAPLMFGLRYFTLVGAAITILLILEAIAMKKRINNITEVQK